jgi:hypothetical protein
VLKQLLATIGVSVLVLVAGVFALVAVCVVGGVIALWHFTPDPVPDAAPAPRPAGDAAVTWSPTDFDGPPWALGLHQGSLRGFSTGFTHQPLTQLAAEEFDRIGAAPVELPAATMVCRVTLEPGGWDQNPGGNGMAPPDALVVLAVEGYPTRGARGPEDSHVATVLFPLVNLRRGAAITLTVSDRDVAFNDPAGTSTVRYDGHFPLRFQGARFTGECRGIGAARGLELIGPALQSFDDHVDHLPSPASTSHYDEWRLEGREVQARKELVGLAAWLGWTHPAVHERLPRLEALAARHPQLVADTIAARPLSTRTVGPEEVRVRLVSWQCGAAARGRCGVNDERHCAATVAIARRSDWSPWSQLVLIQILSREGVFTASSVVALPEARQHCLTFDTGGTAPAVLDGSSPTLLLIPETRDALRVQ